MQGVRGGGHLPAPAPEKTYKDCGGSSICPHQRERNKCNECGEAQGVSDENAFARVAAGSAGPQGAAAPAEPAGAHRPRLLKLA
jgi:hypothetical protein